MKNLQKLVLLLALTSIANLTLAQKIYNPKADAKKDIENAVAKAKQEGQHVLLQIGGNWCPWCIKMHNYLTTNKGINKIINENYVFIVVNYSNENKNTKVMKMLDYPQRFGFPVMVVLNAKGTAIHTQDTGYLEQGKGYDFKKVRRFLLNWRPDALLAENYK